MQRDINTDDTRADKRIVLVLVLVKMYSTYSGPKFKNTSPKSCSRPHVVLVEDRFDYITDSITAVQVPVRSFTWTNQQNVSVQVINYGATITKIKMPDRNEEVEDIVLGYDDMKGYQTENNPYFGATVGRVCNRIANGQFELDGETYYLAKNLQDKHHLHGGCHGFDKKMWNAFVEGNEVIMTYLSPDGEEGYPGALLATVTFELTSDNRFIIKMEATATKPTPVNMTNHSYFNLGGHASGVTELEKHMLSVNAAYYTVPDSDNVPTGEIQSVAHTDLDLVISKKLANIMCWNRGGFDHNFCVNKSNGQGLCFVARVVHTPSGRALDVYSDQPGVQVYTSNFLPPLKPTSANSEPVPPVIGKQRKNYYQNGAICLETQNYPDAVHHNNFPTSILNPGDVYSHICIYKLSVNKVPPPPDNSCPKNRK